MIGTLWIFLAAHAWLAGPPFPHFGRDRVSIFFVAVSTEAAETKELIKASSANGEMVGGWPVSILDG